MIAIAIVGIGLLLGGVWWLTGQTPAPGLDLTTQESAEDADVDTSGVLEMSLGDPDAPVTIVEYASFTCPHCRAFHEGAFKDLKADYIDTGKVNFIYREVYFDQFGLWAGMVARCGGPERYFAIADLIYQQQQAWLASRDPSSIAANLRRIGKSAGLNDAELDQCLQDGDMAKAMVAVYQENATTDSIRSTPSFVINGTTYTNMAYGDLSSTLDDAGAN